MRFALVALMLAATVSGCLSDEAGGACTSVEARFSDGVLLAPPGERSYDGSDMTRVGGAVELATNDRDDSGHVVARLDLPQGRLDVNWTEFHSDIPWKAGGIASNVVEHGASGHGHRMEPEMRLCSGGWGTTANVTFDGQPLLDPITGESRLNAHYMLAKDAMMVPDTLAVYQADGKTPYDPQDAGNGHVDRGREEGHFAIWGEGAYADGHAVAAPAPNTTTYQGSIPTPPVEATHSIPVDAVMTGINVRVSVQTALADVELRGPDGDVLATGKAASNSPATLIVNGPLERGDHTLVVAGAGAGDYNAEVTVTPPAPLLIHVVFLEVEHD